MQELQLKPGDPTNASRRAIRLTPEPALPIQFHDLWHHRRTVDPSRALALAVLERALKDIQDYRGNGSPELRRDYLDACAWVESDDMLWPFSFLSLCHLLDLSPDAVRRTLLREREGRAQAA